MAEPTGRREPRRRMRLTGLHHVTLICRDLERNDRVLPRPAGARARARDDQRRRPRLTALLLRRPRTARPGRSSRSSSTRRFRRAWSAPDRPTTSPSSSSRPRSRSPGATTCAPRRRVHRRVRPRRSSARSTCATPTATSSRSRPAARASTARPPGAPGAGGALRPAPAGTEAAGERGRGPRATGSTGRPALAVSSAASVRRWRSVIDPIVLFSDIGQRCEELAAARASPPALAHQQVRDRHALGFPRAVDNDLVGVQPAAGDAPLELGSGEAHSIGKLEGPHVLRARGDRRSRVHLSSLLAGWRTLRFDNGFRPVPVSASPRWGRASTDRPRQRTVPAARSDLP